MESVLISDEMAKRVRAERLMLHYRNTLGEEYPRTLTAMNALAVARNHLGDHQKAAELEEYIYTLRLKLFGDRHSHTLSALSNLAYSYGATGNPAKEAELRKQVYLLRVKVLGAEHPDTVTALNKLQKAQEKLIEPEKPVVPPAPRDPNVCPHCGGTFTGLFRKKCKACGRPKGN